MKLLIVSIIVCIVIIGCVEANRPAPPKPGCLCACPICGPGGVPCEKCPSKSELCEDLIKKLNNLERQIRQCVCGEPWWMLPSP